MSRVSSRRNVNRLRLIRSYTMRETSEVLGVHVRTVQNWHKHGLGAIDEADRPLLFLGCDVRDFLVNRRKAAQCYCLKCRAGVVPRAKSVSVEVTDRKVGNESRQVILRGVCQSCGATVVRFETTESIQKTGWGAELTGEQLTIDGYLKPPLKR